MFHLFEWECSLDRNGEKVRYSGRVGGRTHLDAAMQVIRWLYDSAGPARVVLTVSPR